LDLGLAQLSRETLVPFDQWQQPLDRVDRQERIRVDDDQLLFDSDRERQPRPEAMLERRGKRSRHAAPRRSERRVRLCRALAGSRQLHWTSVDRQIAESAQAPARRSTLSFPALRTGKRAQIAAWRARETCFAPRAQPPCAAPRTIPRHRTR